MKTIVLIAQLCFCSIITLGQTGTLDLSFNGTGKVTKDFGSSDEEAFATAIQSNGKIIVAGYTLCCSNAEDFAMVRYNTNGSIDNTFGVNGRVITDFAGAFTATDIAHAIVIQADGKIILGGQQFNPTTGQSFSGKNNFAFTRYDSFGNLDATFGNGGKVITDFGGPKESSISSLLIQPDGKIIAAGDVDSLNNTGGITPSNFAMVRYNTNGTLDNTFGNNGMVVSDLGGSDVINSIALLPSGKIIAAGRVRNTNYYDSVAVARYNSNGTIDNSFGTNGRFVRMIGNDSGAEDVAIQQDGKIVITGGTQTGSYATFYVARLDSTGVYDNTFGTNGVTTTNFLTGLESYARAVMIQPDGKIIAGGTANAPYLTTLNNNNFALARYTTNGVLDITFGTNGMTMTDFSPTSSTHFSDYGNSLAMQSDGKIVLAGTSAMNFAAARYLNNTSVGINNISDPENSVILFPNPVSSFLTVKVADYKNAYLKVYDAVGRELISQNIIDTNTQLDFSNQSAGIYIAEIISNNKSSFQKIIKK